MPTTFVKGDIFEDAGQGDGKHAFAFAGDTSGAMTAGIAVAFAKRWPELGKAYRARAEGGALALGDVFAWHEGDVSIYALALFRERKPGRISHVSQALDAMLADAASSSVSRIAMPRIGAGKDAMDWTRVKRVLAETGDRTTATLVVYEQFVRTPAS